MRGTLRRTGAVLAFLLGVSGLTQIACNEIIGATDPIPESPDAGHMSGPAGGMDATVEAPPAPICTEGALGCSPAGWTRVCEDGGWVPVSQCPYVCEADSGTCGGECLPHSKRCVDAGAEVCGADGTWGQPESCTYVCLVDECSGVCAPGATKCVPPSAFETCDPSAEWGSGLTSCMPTEICRADAGSCVNAVHDVGWNSGLTSTFGLVSGDLYVLRLPTLTHSAQLKLFGAYGTGVGPHALLVLYADNGMGTAPTGSPVASVANPLALASGARTQFVAEASVDLSAGTYWLGIEVDEATSISWAPDTSAVGWTYEQNYADPYPDLTNALGYDTSNIDLGIFVTVQDTN